MKRKEAALMWNSLIDGMVEIAVKMEKTKEGRKRGFTAEYARAIKSVAILPPIR